jgi:hypothetical protein
MTKSGRTIESRYAEVSARASSRARFRDPGVAVPAGKIHGTGHHVGGLEAEQLRKLRERDPKVFTWRRLGLVFGVTDTQAWRVYHLLTLGTCDNEEVHEERPQYLRELTA